MSETRAIGIFAALLSAMAGFIDAVGWLTSGGLFVSFMSGNVTKVGLGLAGLLDGAALGAALLAAFVGGVVIGSLAGRAAGSAQRSVVLWLVTSLVTLAAICLETGMLVPAVLLLAAGMGAKNTVFAENGEVKIGLTYMTGALVRTGKRIATALLGGNRFGWVAPASLFLGMMAGAALGAFTQAALGPRALWVAAAVLLTMTLAAYRLPGSAEDPLDLDSPAAP